MLFELVKRIREEFASSRFELISQIAISDDEYEELLQYVRDKVKNSYVQMLVPSDEVLSVAMVQIHLTSPASFTDRPISSTRARA